jgi:DNA replication initiation complex subunit (GINS family)
MLNELFKAWKREESEKNIQSLSPEFYLNLNLYINELKKKMESEQNPIKIEIIKEEYNNAIKLSIKLVNLRFRKVLENILEGRKVPLEILAEEEKEAAACLNKAAELIFEFKEKIFKGRIEEKKSRSVIVRLLQELPAIVGEDLKVYGPFEAEDIAVLPEGNAEALIKRGVAEKINYKE